ncbi:MAG: hypothetical protein QME49_04660 [bacterium]|nr:hypothetical protein [bacterium]
MTKTRLIFTLILLCFSSQSRAEWDILKTPHFTCFYPEGYKWEAEQTLANLEHYRQDVVNLTGNKRIGNLPVVVEDAGMFTNGFADPIFKNIHIFTYAPDSLTPLGIAQNWYRQVAVHEYTHIAHLTRTEGIPMLVTTINGSIYQPNLYSPGWLTEGITVFSESNLSPYEGRLNDGGFDALLKANIKENKPPSILKSTYSPLEFPGESGQYVYGGEFFKYLSDKYGTGKFSQFFEATSGAGVGYSIFSLIGSCIFPYFGIDRAARKIYGKSFPNLFSEWRNSIDASSWKIDGEQVTEHGWMVSHPVLSDNKLYYIRSYPEKTGIFETFEFNEIVERDLTTEDERVLVSTTSWFVGNIRKVGDNLYYTVAELKKGYSNSSQNGFGINSHLHQKDLSAGKKADKVLFSDQIRGFSLTPDGKIIYARDKKHAFGSELWTWSETEGKKKLISSDLLISEILCLEDGKMAAVARPDWENWNVYLLDMATVSTSLNEQSLAARELTPIMPTPSGEFTISCYGKKIFFASNHEKTYSIYAYDMDNGKTYRLTNTGLATFPVFDGNNLYFVGLNSAGLDIYKKSIEKFEEVSVGNYPKGGIPPAFSRLKAKNGTGGDYLKTLLPKIHIPIGLPYPEGAILVGKDAIGENFYTLDFFKDNAFLFYQSSHFKPSILSFIISKDDDDSSQGFWWDYLLRKRIASPLSVLVGLGERLEKKDSKKTNETDIFTQFSLNFPKTKLDICPMISYSSRKDISPEKVNWQTLRTDMYLTQYTNKSQVDIMLSGLYQPDSPEKKEVWVRGEDNSLKGNKLAQISAEYTRPVLSINGGLWNPNIFLYDLCLSVFVDAGFAEEQKAHVSGGIELWQEFGGFLGYIKGAVAVIGVVKTKKEKGLKAYLSVKCPGKKQPKNKRGQGFNVPRGKM